MNSKCAVSVREAILVAACLAAAGPAQSQSQAPADPAVVEVHGGTASFAVDTNVPAISVHGKSTALEAKLRLRQGAEGTVLEGIEAAVPVKTLGTGMGMRDEHMRKYVFTTADGQVPDLRFSSDKAVCATNGSAQPSTCRVSGMLAIRGTPRPFTIDLKVTGGGETFRAVGDGAVSLSAYGIERPSQLGVQTADEVKLRFDFTAKQSTRAVATSGRK